jgi:sterol desaturase/sphingolipid hydroxylase (fatty acid hydroxylase superfamily)
MEHVLTSLRSVTVILVCMAGLALLEALVPLRPRALRSRARLAPNLALTGLAFAVGAPFNVAIVLALVRLESAGGGLLTWLALPPTGTTVLAVLALDLAFYAAHVAMHRVPALWRLHRVHHCDAMVDVTTSIRQHPGETAVRYAFLAAGALAVGASPGAYAIHRSASVLFALLEHANLRLPPRVDDMLAWIVTWPTFHKVHHARDPRLTDTNYGNLVSWWDRLFGTFTPASHGAEVTYGLDDFDDARTQSTAGLLALPFRRARMPAGSAGEPHGGTAEGA